MLLAYAGVGPSGSRCNLTREAAGTRPIVSISGAERTQRREHVGGEGVVAEHGAVDHRQPAAADLGRHRVGVGHVEQPERRRDARRVRPRTRRPSREGRPRPPSSPRRGSPATTSSIGKRSNSSAQTTPRGVPPPRSAQNRSGSLSAVARTKVPSASTSSTAVIGVALQAQAPGVPADAAADASSRPRRRLARTGAARPGRGLRRPRARSPHSTPAPTRAMRLSGSMRSSFMAEVRSSTASASRPSSAGAPCPVPWARRTGRRRPRRARPRRPRRGTPGRPLPLGGRGHLEVPRRARHVVRRVARQVHRAAAEPTKARRAEALLHCHGSLLSWP